MSSQAQLTLLRWYAMAAGKTPCAVILLERLGDLVACGPVALEFHRRHKEAYVVWICRKTFKSLAAAIPGVDTVVCVENLDELEALKDTLKDWEKADLTLRGKRHPDNQREWQKTEGDPSITTETYYNHGALLQAMCKGAGFSVENERPRLVLPKTSLDKARAVAPRQPYVVLHCTSDEAARNWNAQGWKHLASHIIKQGYTVVEIGQKPSGYLEPCEGLKDATGKTSILETAALIKGAKLFIGIDSGPAHVANAVETPGLILLGRYRVFDSYVPYTGCYAEGGAILLRHEEECPFLPEMRVIETATRALRALRHGGCFNKIHQSLHTDRQPKPAPEPGTRIASLSQGLSGNMDEITPVNGSMIRSSGWACLPALKRAPDHLVFARHEPDGTYQVQKTIPFTRLERPDVAGHFGEPRLGFCGFSFSTNLELPCSVLVHDSEVCSTYLLRDIVCDTKFEGNAQN